MVRTLRAGEKIEVRGFGSFRTPADWRVSTDQRF
jgi:nucleoid DNA-binding protein